MQGQISRSARRSTPIRKENHPAKPRPAPIFIYSGFRASSTWLWSKFRAHEELLCYYEPFNEQLVGLTLPNIGMDRPDGWRSHHPSGAPYVLEYAGMLGEEAGVPGFPVAKDLGERYIGALGANGPLDDDITAYVQGLVDHAQQRGRVPVLACTRLLGRTLGLKEAFGGYHILLVRNLFHQWNSYAGQARFGNWYFLQSLFETLALAKQDPIIARLVKFFPEETCISLEAWVSQGNFDRVFCYFVGFHVYFLTLAKRSANLVVYANGLATSDPQYRREIVAKIAQDVGVELDLEDASERVDFPLYPIGDSHTCKILIDEIADIIKSSCDLSANEEAFIDGLVADIWTEQAMFRRQTAGAVEYIALLEERLQAAQHEAAQQMAGAGAEREASAAMLDAVRSELEDNQKEARAELTRLQARLEEQEARLLAEGVKAREEAHAELTRLQARLEEQEARLLAEGAKTREDLASTRSSLEDARETLGASRSELEVAQAHAVRREDKIAIAVTEIKNLRSALAASETRAAGLQARIQQLENSLANVDAAHLDLTGRLIQEERMRQELERRLTS